MMRRLESAARAGALMLAMTATSGVMADAILIDTDTSIACSATNLDGHDVIVDGATLAIDCYHVPMSLELRNGARLVHTPNTAGLHLQIAGDLTIDATSAIDLAGRGRPAACSGCAGSGFGASPYVGSSSSVHSGGAGYGGAGGNGASGVGGTTYGFFVDTFTDAIAEPLELGSSAASSGGAGGGSVRLTVGGTAQIDGQINADGLLPPLRGGGGSGGSIWLAADVLVGGGSISADGGVGFAAVLGGGGGGGRIALDVADNQFSGFVTACGGRGYQRGGAGTVFHYGTGSAGTLGTIVADNCGNIGEATEFSGANELLADVVVRNGALIAHPHSDPGFHLIVHGNTLVEADGAIDVGGRGEPGGCSSCDGQGLGRSVNVGSSTEAHSGGAGHGGAGGNGEDGAGGGTYGPFIVDFTEAIASPVSFGSGAASSGARGGGAVRLTVHGVLTVEGRVSADGSDSLTRGGAGAGGSIWVAADQLAGNGTISSDGGVGFGTNRGGGGGGGRIALDVGDDQFGGSVTACGGRGFERGGAGTVFYGGTGSSGTLGTVIVDNCGTRGEATEFNGPQTIQADLLVRNQGFVSHAHGAAGFHLTVDGNVSVESDGALDADGRGRSPGCSSCPGNGDGASPNVGSASSAHSGGAAYGGAGGDGEDGLGGSVYAPFIQNLTEALAGPVELGSSAASSGGAGGGALRLTVHGVLSLDGAISANGLTPANRGGGGSGGSVWLEAAQLAGDGVIAADGGNGFGGNRGGGGGGGRIALDIAADNFNGTMHACGGQGLTAGGAGTLFLYGATDLVVLDNCGTDGEATELPASTQPHLVEADILVRGGAFLGHAHNGHRLNAFVDGDVMVAADGAIAADGRGAAAGCSSCPGGGFGGSANVGSSSSAYSGGASHAGVGGAGEDGFGSGLTYGNAQQPTQFGSGGASSGGDGGGAIELHVAGLLTIDGRVSANGTLGVRGGGGSGGSVWLTADQIDGAGTIEAAGGEGFGLDVGIGLAGGGGGGRIFVETSPDQFAMSFSQVSIEGGAGREDGTRGTAIINGDGLIDTDDDGVTDPFDICPAHGFFGFVDADGRPIGDVDEDCDVDLSDLASLLATYGH